MKKEPMIDRIVAVTNYTKPQLEKLDTQSIRELYDATAQLRVVHHKAIEEIRQREQRKKIRIQSAIREQAQEKQIEADYHRTLREKIASGGFRIGVRPEQVPQRESDPEQELRAAQAELKQATLELRSKGGRSAIARVAVARQKVAIWEVEVAQ